MRRIELDNHITYEKMFDIMQVQEVVIFEDDFVVNEGKNEIFYGLVRIAMKNRSCLLNEIENISTSIKNQIEEFLIEFDKVFDVIQDWQNEVPYNDIETALDILEEIKLCEDLVASVRNKYELINIQEWNEKEKVINILSTYGAGVEVPALYEPLFDEYIQNEPHWKCFRIYRDFISNTQESFTQYLNDCLENDGTIICILDDHMRNQNCASDIIQCIEKVQSGPKGRLNIVGIILSTYTNADRISDKVYFEYVKKESSRKKIQATLVKSAYSFLLSKLKGTYQNILNDSFDEAIKNKNIAYYLSSMAEHEGITNYQVITNWIKLLFDYKLSGSSGLEYVAGMTRLINLLDDEKLSFSREMLDLNTFEAFDFNVNRFREPIASGDVFLCKKKIYILVGQDCDMMYSVTRQRKSGISELVSATTMLQSNIDNSVKVNSEYIFLSNFRKKRDGDVRTLKVRYSSREFIENQLLQLCQFNDEGKCILNLRQKEYKTIRMEPLYYNEMYSELIDYFGALSKINISEKDALKTIINSSQSKRLIGLLEFDENKVANEIIEYPVQRLCRVKHSYMLYLYKMYLEYQGRHPFDCMNMTRVQEVQVKTLEKDDIFLTVDVILSPDREANRANLGNMDWCVDRNSLEETVSQMLNLSVKLNEASQIIEIGAEEKIYEFNDETGAKRTVKIRKTENRVSIVEEELS